MRIWFCLRGGTLPPLQARFILLMIVGDLLFLTLTILNLAGHGAPRSASYPNPWLSPHEGEGPPEFGPPPAPISGAARPRGLIPVPLEQGDTAYDSLAGQLARRVPIRSSLPYNNRPGK